MKKFFIAGFAVVLLTLPLAAGAQSLQEQLDTLLIMLAKLQVQVAQQNSAQAGAQTSTNELKSGMGCDFTRSLYIGLTGSDVTCLQGYLIEDGYLNVSASGYFGNATHTGVQRWQAANGISNVGTFGPVSRAAYSRLVARSSGGLKDDSTVNSSVNSSPRCTITANKSSYKLGETIKVSWTSQNATYAVFKQDVSGKDHLKLPGDKLTASGSQTLAADVTGNPDVTLFVYNAKGSGSCKVIIPVISANMTSIQVTYPQEGFVLDNSGAKDSGIIANIQWNQQNGNHPVSIYLLDADNQVARTIATRIRDTGTYRWKYDPTLPAGKYQIRVDVLYPAQDGGQPSYGQDNAYSGYFTISSPEQSLTITGHKNGYWITRGYNQYFTWSTVGISSSAPVTIDLIDEAGATHRLSRNLTNTGAAYLSTVYDVDGVALPDGDYSMKFCAEVTGTLMCDIISPLTLSDKG
ncbi:MAG: hypothetical protein COU11_04290 [Candidatus Harrisonbacteria bacterium CG10_big_fil_rev_8_21_14_0_10_49_15]|uniref:Uncharacterized protein n=1 Tax=Candidatus Harrisonbacteria bacterium CG10_big_fil_rev_8_21_14_0_10_49_15 TaxID=1974587 RepID=A0A2H0UJY2_9BACT|nr:MAG: hypothetical protein COU11_04290 [Candidatus Harrisonbacteria bacterium CG10_big_fil_rev_8_21_14_0_10_49_15]